MLCVCELQLGLDCPISAVLLLYFCNWFPHYVFSLQDLDALIIPGGFAPDYWRRDHRFLTLVREMYQSGKTVAAICHGPWMFVSAGILKGRRVTCFCSIKDDVINAG